MKTGIIGAMESEVQGLLAQLNEERTVEKATMVFHQGNIHGRQVVVVKCGVGKVNAALCAQILIDEFAVTQVINTGAAGSLNDELNIGDVVISRDVVHHDFDTSALGDRKGEIFAGRIGFEADPQLIEKACHAVVNAASGINYRCGRICSGDQFVSSQAVKQAIIREFSGDCAEMEGAAIGQCCWVNHVPFVIIRAISDKADEEGSMSFEQFVKLAAANSTAIVLDMLKQMES